MNVWRSVGAGALAVTLAAAWQPGRTRAGTADAEDVANANPIVTDGTLPSGALWSARVPKAWNGTLLLYSHGYSPALRAADVAPRGLELTLLERGYALAASAYSAPGWALAEAVPDQIATLDAFTEKYGHPKRTIAWGNSMGGLVTVALAERYPMRIDAAVPSCGSLAGSLGMMNAALDGAFAFKTLLAPKLDIRIVAVDDDRANSARVAQVLAAAMSTPDGRARVALASALAQLPTWSGKSATEPPSSDIDAQLDEAAATFAMGVFLPRVDQEQRAGGVFSWNTGIDYRAVLAATGRQEWVSALYKKAGLSLEDDLNALNAAPRVAADPHSVAYMRANYVPSGKLTIPVFSYHTLGDGLTAAQQQGAYRALVAQQGASQELAVAWVRRAGHCAFSAGENLAALSAVESRLSSGLWHTSAAELNAIASANNATGAFEDYSPRAFTRPCAGAAGSCPGEPDSARGHGADLTSANASDDVIKSSQYVAVEDGTRLAVDIYRPARGGHALEQPLPVIMLQSLGDRSDARTLAGYGIQNLVKHSYVFVWLQPRGIGASFGKTGGFLTEQNGRDVRDVIVWSNQQPWSNGKVGMLGLSNLGFIQWLAATLRPPGLLTIVPAVANPDFYYQLYPNGTSALGGAPGTARRNAPPVAAPKPLEQPVDEDAAPDYALWEAAQKSHAGGLSLPDEWLVNMMRDQINPRVGYAPGLVDSPLPAYMPALRDSQIRIFQMGGWADASPGGQIIAQHAFGGKIVIGSWPHMLMAEDQGAPLLRAEHLRWFDYTLKGISNGIEKEPPVHYQVQNVRRGDGWRFAAAFPPATQHLQDYFLAAGRSKTVDSANDGILANNRAHTRQGFDAYREVFDIQAFDGTYNRLKRSWDGDMTAGVDRRALTYTSEALKADTEVTGFPVAHIWMSADAPDSDLIVYLEEVNPNGRSHFVTDGTARASHRLLEDRAPWSKINIPFHRSYAADRQLLKPNEPVLVSFALTPTSYLFRKSSKIRFTVTAGEQNTYQPPAEIDADHPPVLRIYRDRAHASRLVLPVTPAN